MIDCGEGTQIQLRRNKLSPARINHIFISHLHGDHVFGLFGLVSSLGMMGRKAALNFYGPEALERMLRAHLEFFGQLPFELKFHTCTHNKVVFENSKSEVLPVKLKHRTETFGYVFREKPGVLNIDKSKIALFGLGVEDIRKIKNGEDYLSSSGRVVPNSELTLPPLLPRSYAYISDTSYLPDLVPYIKEVDLLFHEATFLEKDAVLAEQTFHSTSKQAAAIAKEAKVGKLLIGHFSTRYKKEEAFLEEARQLFSDTIIVNDGDRFKVGLRREEKR